MSLLANIQNGDIGRAIAEQQQNLDPIRQYIFDHFGQNGLYAAYFLVAAAVLLLAYKVVKLSFHLMLFVALPAAISAFLLSFVLPFSFFYLLPATAAVFTLGLVMRHVAYSEG